MSYQNTSLVSDIEEDPYYNQNIPHLHHLDYPQNNSVSTFATCCPDYMLCCCKVFSTFTSLCLFSILVLNSIATLVTISIEQFWTYPSRSILNLYSLSFNFIAFLCEMELTESIRNMQMLQSWTLRGFFYVFVSLFSIQETNINEGSYFRAVNSLSTISVLFCGILYIILVSRERCRFLSNYNYNYPVAIFAGYVMFEKSQG